MKQSIIIPYHKDRETIKYSVKSVVSTVPPETEIIIIGNNYNKKELQIEFPYPNCHYYMIDENLYYPGAINYGVSKSSGEIITLYDPDVFALPNWYEPLLDYMERSEVGAVSSKLINPCTGRIIDFGMYYSKFNAIHSLKDAYPTHPLAQFDRKVQSACSAVMMTKRSLFDAVGGMNPDLPYSHTDMDYCLKLKQKGYETWVSSKSEVYHKGSSDKNNSKSYAFTYLSSDSKGLFYANNYKLFDIDFSDWFNVCWNHFKKTHPSFFTEFVLLDFSTMYNRMDYYETIKNLGISIMDKQVITVSARDIEHIYLHQSVPFGLIALKMPILYFVDSFISLLDNDLWFTHRNISGDLVIDRHGNIYILTEIANRLC